MRAPRRVMEIVEGIGEETAVCDASRGVLGIFDGLTALFAPEVRDQIGGIVSEVTLETAFLGRKSPGEVVPLLGERVAQGFEKHLSGLADAIERHALAVAVHRTDDLRGQDRREDSVAV